MNSSIAETSILKKEALRSPESVDNAQRRECS
jgi:hypothetical protein